MLRQIRHTVLCALLTLSITATLSSCVAEHRIDSERAPSRVLLVYIGADNNLSGFEREKMDGIRAGWSGSAQDKILAYVDRSNEGALLCELSVPTGSEPSVIATYGRQNSASAEVFARVIADVLASYKADAYNLLIFSHASGWLPQGALTRPTRSTGDRRDAESSENTIYDLSSALTDGNTRSVIVDGANEMELSDFAAAIPDGVFHSIAFEACFMAGIEVAYELRHKADHILASSAEIIHPGFAPSYATATAHLLDGDLQQFGQNVFGHTLTYAETSVQRSATYSVINTAPLDRLAAFVRTNCDLSRAVFVEDIQRFDRYSYRLFFDFEDYYGRLLDTDIQRTELASLIDECVTWKAATPTFMTQQSGYNGFSVDRHSGLTAYVPQAQFAGLNAAYGDLAWAKATAQNKPRR